MRLITSVLFCFGVLFVPNIGVLADNQVPQAGNDTAVVAEGQLVTIDILANDADPDGSINANSLFIFQPNPQVYQPVNGWLRSEPDGRITYGHYGGPTTSDTFYYVVADDSGEYSEPAMVTITIGEPEASLPAPDIPAPDITVEPVIEIPPVTETPPVTGTPIEVPVAAPVEVPVEIQEEIIADPAFKSQGLSAFHRDGQTFLTWDETPSLDGYHVYRHSQPIDNANIGAAQRITDRWGPLDNNTSVNSHGSPEAPRNFVIQNLGAMLSDDTGLFVYTTQAGDSATAWYAVTGVNNGVESLATLMTLSSPVAESVQRPRDVLTVSINGGRGRLYTQYMDYSNWNPTFNGYAYNYSVALPSQYNPSRSYPLMVHPHAYFENNKFVPQSEFNWQVISLFPHDPGPLVGAVHSWWYGYAADHNYQLNGPVPSSGVIENFTEQRVMRAIDELRFNGDFNIDDQLIHGYGNSMGATGLLAWGMRYPTLFSGVYASQPMTNFAASPGFQSELVQLWGTQSNNLPVRNRGPHSQSIRLYGVDGAQSMRVWDWMNHQQQLVQRRGDDFAYLMTSHGKLDTIIDWQTQGRPIAQSFTNARAGFSARNTGAASHTWLSFDSVVTPLFGFGFGQDFNWKYPLNLSFPSIQNASNSTSAASPNSGNDAYNADIEWATSHLPFDTGIVDTPNRYEITLRSTSSQQSASITPRRTQQFSANAGDQCSWSTTNRNNNQQTGSGLVTADIDSLVTVTGVVINTGTGTRLTIDC